MLDASEVAGARTRLFDGCYLAGLPVDTTAGSDVAAAELLETVRAADGLSLASPGCHGSISGAVKNAIDYVEALASGERTYLDGMPVGAIVTAFSWQDTGSTLAALRSIVHAPRGWPMRLAAAINTAGGIFSGGVCIDGTAADQLALVGRQVAEFATSARS